MFARLWWDNKRYFLIGTIILIAGIAIGFLQSDLVESIARDMLSQVKEVAGKLKGSQEASTFFRVIFLNNLLSSVLMMILGLFFAIFPIYGLLANSILLGYLLEKMSAAGLNPLQVFLVGILPHGIFELPAVVFAASMGIRYGFTALRTLFMVWRPDERAVIRREWVAIVKQFPIALLVVVVLLVIAAFVESVITPMLLQKTIGNQIQFMK